MWLANVSYSTVYRGLLFRMAFTFNSSNGALYVSKSSKNVVLKFDPLVKKPLKTIHLGKAPLWKRFASVLFEFAEPVSCR